MEASRKVFTNKSNQLCTVSMNGLLHLKKETQMWKLDSPSFALSILNGLPLQVHQEHMFVCVSTTHQNTILLVDALKWEVTYKDLVNKVVCDPSNCECMMHRCANCPGKNALRKLLEEELSDIDLIFSFTTHSGKLQT